MNRSSKSSENNHSSARLMALPMCEDVGIAYLDSTVFFLIADDVRTPPSAARGLSGEINATAQDFKEPDVLLMSQGSTVQRQSRKQTSMKTQKMELVCTTCGKNCASLYSLKIHASTHDISASFMCEICGRLFRHLASLHRHIRYDHTSHSREPTSLLCNVCGKAFRDACDLKRHRPSHSVEKSCLCSTCSQVFPNRGALHKHRLLQHGKVPMDKLAKHECAVCKRWFEDTRKLLHHSVVHTKQRPFVCVLCAKAYSQNEALRQHQRTKHQN
ncbi:Zinc finger protein 579 [Clonorchis sinensis]|uniref:Zinc finger protein 579 n=1 Tax=Clonorchis sinensis TaxID=79923 RepID=A0A3R7CEM2_CLOSI|nr:Zinc finger protein 579 [Clonorchis sinensis]